jgi:CubicO group peptidase (beta-lactamase class C family)
MSSALVHGTSDPRFAKARAVFESNIAGESEVGASFCVTKDGETLVDLWGGYADPAKTRPWRDDTIVNVYSTTKTMTALCALMLADRGELDFESPVARYWPEFAHNGKSAIKVSHLMSHSAGLSAWTQRIDKEDLYDWDKVVALLADQAPLWEPGTQPGYHAITQGYLVGEVVRRITGLSLGTFFRTQVAEPLEADFHIGLPASQDERVAELIPPPPGQAAGDGAQSEIQRLTLNNPGIDVAATRTRAWRGAEIPAAGGTGNARSVAEIHVILANGGIAKGRRFLSEAGCRKALEVQIEGQDLVLGGPARFGLGFGLAGGVVPLPNPNTIYWGGYGGSLVIIDMDARSTIAYAMNKMAGTTTGDMRALGLALASFEALGLV